MKNIILKILKEDWTESEWDAHETYDDFRRGALYELMNDLLDKKQRSPKQKFNVAPIARITKIWTDFSKTGLVRDEKGINDIGEIFVKNIAMLDINTELAGHSPNDPIYLAQEYDENLPKKKIEKLLDSDRFYNYITDYNGQLRISDYGLEPLKKLAFKLLSKDKTYEEKILTLDGMLNVIHQRSDLSRLFVEGGSKSLDALATNESKQFIKKLIREYLNL